MNLTPRGRDEPSVPLAAVAARGRPARGVRPSRPEAVAPITGFSVEDAQIGLSVAELMAAGAHVITAGQCREGGPEMIDDVQIGATFHDGTKLVTVHHPIRAAGAAPEPASPEPASQEDAA
jgi:urease subunit gamma